MTSKGPRRRSASSRLARQRKPDRTPLIVGGVTVVAVGVGLAVFLTRSKPSKPQGKKGSKTAQMTPSKGGKASQMETDAEGKPASREERIAQLTEIIMNEMTNGIPDVSPKMRAWAISKAKAQATNLIDFHDRVMRIARSMGPQEKYEDVGETVAGARDFLMVARETPDAISDEVIRDRINRELAVIRDRELNHKAVQKAMRNRKR